MQELLVILVVGAAVAYLIVRLYKSIFSAKSSCDVNCGCEAGSPALERLKKRK